MSSTLLKVAREHSSVVAVVGKGHLSGIKKHWKQPIEVRTIFILYVCAFLYVNLIHNNPRMVLSPNFLAIHEM